MGPRLVERGKPNIRFHGTANVTLQWGRAWLSAESSDRQRRRRGRHPASMGPRLVERGKAQGRGGWTVVDPPLQWGRAWLSAERPWPRARYQPRSVGLQWGRAWLSAERPLELRIHAIVDRASMGPRLVERGKRINAGRMRRAGRASMGLRLVERGKLDRGES